MLWKIPVTWEMYGCVQIEAETLEEAMAIAEDPDGLIPLPDNGEYVDGSWALSCTETDDVLVFQTPQNRQKDSTKKKERE